MIRRRAASTVFVVVALALSACTSIDPTGDAAAGESREAVDPVESPAARPTVARPTATAPTANPPTATPLPEPSATAVPPTRPAPTAAPEPTRPAPTAAPEPTPVPVGWVDGACQAPATAQPDPNRPEYDADVTIDPRAGVMRGRMSISFSPDIPTDEVVLRLWPNGPREAAGGAEMSTWAIEVNGSPVEVDTTDPTMRRIPLASTLAAGDSVEVSLAFDVFVPNPARARVARGTGPDPWLRLGSALPILAWEPGVGWATDPGTAQFAEAVTSPTANYRVRINAPPDYAVLTSGIHDGDGLWTGTAIRDFSISVGHFAIVERTVMAPGPVQVTMGVDQSVAEDPVAYMDRIEASLIDFSETFAPYPWESLSVALTPGIGGGIEFPNHIMLGDNTIGRTTPHEVAHMFFYSLVGNNQSRNPWLDEGLASYAEFLHEGRNLAALAYPQSELGNSGQPLPFFAGRSGYYDTVYVQPAVGVANLGPRDQVNCALRIYLAQNAFGVADPNDFFDAVEIVFPNAAAVLAPYGITR